MDPEEGEEFENEDLDELEDEGQEPEGQQNEEDDPEEGELENEPPRQPSRAQKRIEELDRRTREFERVAQEAADRAERAERQLRELQSGSSRAEAERREQERLERMDPEERLLYQARQTQERTTSEIATLRHQIADSTDRAEFASACATNPALAKVKDDVEAELAKLRASGSTVPRQTLAAFLVGKQLLEKAPQARARAAKRAAGNLERERARPAGGASEATRSGGKDEKAARDKRLDNYTF